MTFAIMDGLELQWLLDPTVDIVVLLAYGLPRLYRRLLRQAATVRLM